MRKNKRRLRCEPGGVLRGNFQFLDRFYLERYESDSRKPRTFLPENWMLLKSLKTHPETVSAWSQPVLMDWDLGLFPLGM